MEKELFSPMAIDALGEMMNISLGSSATAVSNMLDHRVDITTPTVKVIKVSDFSLGKLEPAMGVEIKYVEGLEGSNIMLLKKSDVKVITDILMGTETPDEEFELNELTISCVCEVMNQMMGSAATALSDFLGYSVNISTPEAFEVDDMEEFKRARFPFEADVVVIVSFSLKIEGALESEFMNVMSVELAKELVAGLGLEEDEDASAPPAPPPPAPSPEPSGAKLSQEEIERLMQGGAAAESPPPAPSPEPSGAKLSQEEIERLMQGGAAAESPPPAPSPEPSGAKLSQEEIERLMQGGAAAESPPPAPSPEPSGAKLSQEEIERLMQGGAAAQPAAAPAPATTPAPAAAPAPAQQPAAQMPAQPMQMQAPPQGMPVQAPDGGAFAGGYMGYPPMYYPPYPYPYPPQAEPPEPKVINTQPVKMSQLESTQVLNKEQAENLDLIMEVPLQVTVEIGRTKRKVQEILEFAKGSLVVLDKLAGDQVDLFVNGKCIAKGDVVVIDDNFGVRITELLQDQVIEGNQKK